MQFSPCFIFKLNILFFKTKLCIRLKTFFVFRKTPKHYTFYLKELRLFHIYIYIFRFLTLFFKSYIKCSKDEFEDIFTDLETKKINLLYRKIIIQEK